MAVFVQVEDSLVNVDHIQSIQSTGGGRSIVRTQGRVYETSADLGSTIVQIIPTDGEWEVVHRDDSLPKGVYCEPVIAWGLTLEGAIIPVTARSRAGELDAKAWRRKGAPDVYEPDTGYLNIEDWRA